MNKKGFMALAAVCLCLSVNTNTEDAKVIRKEPIKTAEPTQEKEEKKKEKATKRPTQTQVPTEEPECLEEELFYDSLEELALCVEAEAGNQGLQGKRMVACVILNRVDDTDWPNSISEVIEQKYQFASYWNGAMQRVIPSDETYKAINLELEERSYPGLFYFTAGGYGDYGTPWGKVGDHYFCKK